MIVNRDTQVITSKYGKRNGFLRKHKGVDLRVWDDSFTNKLEILLPVKATLIRAVYQEQWLWTYIFRISDEEIIKFTHMQRNDSLIDGNEYEKGHYVGLTGLSEYMKKKKYGDHLHFEYWDKENAVNPTEFFDSIDLEYRYK